MTQKLPLPLTPAMLAKANAVNEAKPRYHGAGVAGDWVGGDVGNDVNAATAAVAVVGAATANFVLPDYTPRTQVAKGAGMAPALTVLADIGIDYGVYAGLEGRDGTVQPHQPYPAPESAETPVWVPANAKIHIDFLGGSPQGRAWSNGAAVDIGTLIGNDPVADSAWGDTTREYDSGYLTANGYFAGLTAFLGAAKTRMTGDVTVVFQFYEDTTVHQVSMMWSSSDGGAGFQIDADPNPGGDKKVYFYSNVGGFNRSTGADLVFSASGIANKIATTLVTNRWDVACNGGTAVSGPLTITHRPAAKPMTCAFIDASFSNLWLQSITLYDPLPTTAGLSELSAI